MGKVRVTARRRALLKGAAAASAYAVVGSPLLGCNGSSDSGTGSVEASDGSRSGVVEWGGDWEAEGVANLWVDGERRFLQGGSDVYPHDPRVVAFERDRRFLDGAVEGVFTATGVGGGVVLRRTGPFQYYAAVYDAVTGLFSLIRKTGRRFGDAGTSTEQTLQTLTDESERVLATIPALNLTGPVTIRLAADSSGGSGTALSAVLRNGQGLEFPLPTVPWPRRFPATPGCGRTSCGLPQLRPILDNTCFAAQRDDHDYGRNDLRAEDIPTHGIVPWERLMNPETYYRFDAGPLGVWVLDQRRFADAASAPNTEDKSLLGMAQREWLLETLAESTAPFKIICSPMPFFFSVNNDTGWSGQFSAERALILQFLRDNVGGHIVAATGDAHSGAVVDRPELLEMRASPLDIPVAGWKAPSSGAGVVYSDVGKFYTVLRTGEVDGAPFLDVELARVGLGLGLDLADEEIKTPVFQRRLHA